MSTAESSAGRQKAMAKSGKFLYGCKILKFIWAQKFLGLWTLLRTKNGPAIPGNKMTQPKKPFLVFYSQKFDHSNLYHVYQTVITPNLVLL